VKKVIQKRVVRVVQPEIVEYYCDRCGKRCGIKGNRKTTWHPMRNPPMPDKHYCEKTCHPYDHPGWERKHVLGCALCYAEAEDRGETWMRESLLGVLAGR